MTGAGVFAFGGALKSELVAALGLAFKTVLAGVTIQQYLALTVGLIFRLGHILSVLGVVVTLS